MPVAASIRLLDQGGSDIQVQESFADVKSAMDNTAATITVTLEDDSQYHVNKTAVAYIADLTG